jgi:hypothetical protein
MNGTSKRIILKKCIQGISRAIMNPTELKMQPTIHLQSLLGYLFLNSHVNFGNVLWVAFSTLPGSLSLVKYSAFAALTAYKCVSKKQVKKWTFRTFFSVVATQKR